MQICKKDLFSLFILLFGFLSPIFSDTIPKVAPDSLLLLENKIIRTPEIRDNSYINKYSDFSFSTTHDFKSEIDTSLSFFHRYNPAYRAFYYTLGNIGLAHHSFVFRPNVNLGFTFGINNFKLWELTSYNTLFFNTRIPYTEANLVVGSKGEQYFQGIHTQNITKDWNFSFQFNKIRSSGFYQNQQSDVTNMSFGSNYLSENKKYGIFLNAFYNNLIAGENGGLSDESYIDDDSRLTHVNLNGAYSRRNSKGFKGKQYYNFTSFIDSVPDSDTSFVLNYNVNKGFYHSFSLEDYRMLFKDDNIIPSYYPAIYFDSLATLDSSQFKIVSNEIGWNDYNKLLMYSVSFEHQYSKVYLNLLERNFYFSNYTFKSSINRSKRNNYFWKVSSSYIVGGDNKGDYMLNGELDYSPAKNHLINLNLGVVHSSPYFMYNRYYSNHYKWENNFDKNEFYTAIISYSNPKMKFKSAVSTSLLNNYIYFNYQAVPQQLQSPCVVTIIKAEKSFKWKRFNLLTELVYQNVSNTNIIRVPDLISRNALFYEFGSNKDLKLQVGLEGFYFSSFKNYRYMPVTGQFFLQDDYVQGNYPFIDFFVNMRIKQARVFFKIDHLNENLLERNFFILPGYPSGERAFRVGISWVFYN
ncbi:MAG: hypothetical protein H0V01_02525 [Bacteroidetes bacterium]|nr:hypothetical protein [Bacteroidota bacterium]HET6244050.1 putative porin [Bacteroidia bacterium]